MSPVTGVDVRVIPSQRVGVANPEEAPVDDDQIGVGVVLQEGRDRIQPIRDVAVIDHAAVALSWPLTSIS